VTDVTVSLRGIIGTHLLPLVSRHLHRTLLEFLHVEQELVHDVIFGQLHVRFSQDVVVQADRFPSDSDHSVLLLVVPVRAALSVDPIYDAQEVVEHHERHSLLLRDALELERRPLRRHRTDWRRELVRPSMLLMIKECLLSVEVSQASFTPGPFSSR